MNVLIQMRMDLILYLLELMELKIRIRITILWLQCEQGKMETLMLRMLDLNFQYDFTINPYLLDVLSHIVIMIIDDVL